MAKSAFNIFCHVFQNVFTYTNHSMKHPFQCFVSLAHHFDLLVANWIFISTFFSISRFQWTFVWKLLFLFLDIYDMSNSVCPFAPFSAITWHGMAMLLVPNCYAHHKRKWSEFGYPFTLCNRFCGEEWADRAGAADGFRFVLFIKICFKWVETIRTYSLCVYFVNSFMYAFQK